MSLLKKLLFPFAFIYGIVTWLRNVLFNFNLLSSKEYSFPIICVGNLSVGGTGKSPMVEYLIDLLKTNWQVATLSRGYKRNTKGFYLLKGNETAKEVGDEPLQFKTKYPTVSVAVNENRQEGIDLLRKLQPQPQIIILDDAFQHRKVTAGFNILLTSYEDLYIKDYLLPMGSLREPKTGAKRAQVIVVTKCPPDLTSAKKQEITNLLKPTQKQSVYFSCIAYHDSVLNEKSTLPLKTLSHFTLVTGIANPKPLVSYLKSLGLSFEHLSFPDHHNFSEKELNNLAKKELILTTEKDYMRLKNTLPKNILYYLSIETKFMENEELFLSEIMQFIKAS